MLLLQQKCWKDRIFQQKGNSHLKLHHFAQIIGAIIPISEQSIRKTIEWEFIQLIVNVNLNRKIDSNVLFDRLKSHECQPQLECTIRYLPSVKWYIVFAQFQWIKLSKQNNKITK